MSELKAFNMPRYAGQFTMHKVYLKSEADKVIAHQKYKRCLAMARWCRTSARCDEGLGAFRYRDWYWKWFKHWLQLAEKFKEGFVIGVDKATGTDKTVVINYKEAK